MIRGKKRVIGGCSAKLLNADRWIMKSHDFDFRWFCCSFHYWIVHFFSVSFLIDMGWAQWGSLPDRSISLFVETDLVLSVGHSGISFKQGEFFKHIRCQDKHFPLPNEWNHQSVGFNPRCAVAEIESVLRPWSRLAFSIFPFASLKHHINSMWHCCSRNRKSARRAVW
jgi:hypothetical protein